MAKGAYGFDSVPLDDVIAVAQADPSDNSSAMNEIIRRFQGQAIRLAGRLTGRIEIHDDLVSAALEGLVAAVRRHDQTRTGFVSYARSYMSGAARRELRVWLGDERCDSMSDPATSVKVSALVAPTHEPGTYVWGFGRLGRTVRLLPDSQQELLTNRYIDDMSLAVIAARSGTTVSAVSQRLAAVHRGIARKLSA